MRKFFCTLCAVLLCCFLPAAAEENLIVNGDFSQLTDRNDHWPSDWDSEIWYTDQGVSLFKTDFESYDGTGICVISNSENDARFSQTISVEPDSIYRISCMCRAEGVGTDMIGANISVKDTFTYSESLYDTNGEWLPLELYGLTGPDQTEMTVYARVGGYGNLNSGKAWFDDFKMVEVEEAPEGVFVESFAPNTSSAKQEVEFGGEDVEPARNTEMYVLLTCLYMLAVLAVAKKHRRSSERGKAFYRDALFIMLCCAFLLRAVLAVIVPGYNTDINCFAGWSGRMFRLGPNNFYSPDYFCDYPPGYMLMLWPIGALQNLFGLAHRSAPHLLLLKLWPILFDIASAWLIWRVAKNTLGDRGAMLMAAFFAFNPAVFTDSAAWGQIDSVYTLLIALCALSACEGKYISSLMCFALSMLVKPQALLFAPLGLLAIIVFCCRSEKPAASFVRLALGALCALGVIYVLSFLCCFESGEGLAANLIRPVSWLIELYGGTMQGYSYVTVNTLNLYYLLDMNWARAEDHSIAMLIAWICFGASYLYCASLCLLSKNRRHLPLIGSLLIVLICAFGPMIHERYVFPALLLLILGYAFARDKRLLISLTVLSAALFLNEFLVLQGGMTEANYGHLQASEDWINLIVAFINVLNAMFLAWTAWDICVCGNVYGLYGCARESIASADRDPFGKQNHRLNLKRADVLLMAAVTLVYSVVAFVNLGSTKAPQTSWISTSADEQIIFDLGDVKKFRMTYYGGICSSNFTVELSNDGEVWTQSHYAKYNQGEIFRWLWYVPMDENENIVSGQTVPTDDGAAYVTYTDTETHPFQTARYVRLSTTAAGLTLSEVAFLDENGGVLPIRSVSGPGEVRLLTDEQNTVGEYPSYYNSSYFDEIYHARTAYEHLHGMNTYEWTHPPLGKVLMMVGIRLFGMTPFGWRFMGAVMGVLMLPLMYLLVKQLTKSTKLSFIAMFLMSVDSMHFTQTRIATIDSYAVFWIMLMYFFMFRYCQMRWTTSKDFLRSLVVLGMCGLTMGVAWATKWIGLYASAGLAILFFWTLWRHFCEFRRADRLVLKIEGSFWKYAGITVAFCMVFFVVIPVLIYYFSYYWHLQSHGVTSIWNMFSSQHVKSVMDLQERIFGYHAGLGGDTHYFRSEWYEWPIIWWPMWYFSGTTYMPDGVISSISCMGNPAVWWFGLAALIFVVVRMCFVRRASMNYILVVISFASQFLPWVLVPRSTFIYHYFASVPFIIIASVLFLKWIERRSSAAFKATALTLCIAALLLFIAFYPLESGLPVARAYANYLRWFSWYNF